MQQAEGDGDVFSDDPEQLFQSDAFDVDPSCMLIAYCHGRNLNFQSIKLPTTIQK